MMGRAGNLFSNVLFKADKSRLTQTKCFLSPSLRRRKRGGETVAREREDSLSLFVLAPFLTRARVSSVSRKWNDDRDSRDARAPFEQKISVDATDKSQLFYLKRKFSALGPVRRKSWRKAEKREELFGGTHSLREKTSSVLFSVLFLSFAASYSFFPSD